METKQTKTYDGLPPIQRLVYCPQLDLIHLLILIYIELTLERIPTHHHAHLSTS